MGGFRGLIAAAFALGTAASGTASAQTYFETPPGEKPRVVITADPELDDANSLIRYLLYAADFETEGLIYASSQFHWTGDGKGTQFFVPGREYSRFGQNLCPCTSWRWDPGERFIDAAVDAYAEAYPNLRIHDPGYPAPEALRSAIRWGNVQFDGEMERDTEGSNLIKALLLDDRNAPVYLHAWGGQSTIARALKSIEEQYKGTPEWPKIRARVIAKAVIHGSGDQDDTYGRYIQPYWPEIRYRKLAGGVGLSYAAQDGVSKQDSAFFTPAWTSANISGRGPLGALYRVWGDGKQMVAGDRFDFFGIPDKSAQELRQAGYVVWTPPQEKGSFLGEGDTPTFLNLVGNGLRGWRGDSFGGWGGYDAGTPEVSFSLGTAALEATAAGRGARPTRAPTHPFLASAQRDFAARFAWATTPRFAGANHPPKIALTGERQLSAKAGQKIALKVTTGDPDGDPVTVQWWRWGEADSYAGGIMLSHGEGRETGFTVPEDAKPGDRIDIIAEATDGGSPALTRYERVVVTVAP